MSSFSSHCFIPFFSVLLLGAVTSCQTDDQKRPSPAASDSTQIGSTKVTIHYSSPGVKKRKIWDELVPYGEVWRTGANKATVLTITGPLLIEGQRLDSGKYAIFTITTDSTWMVVFNKEWDQWGSYNYDEEQDVFRLSVKPKKSDYTERMTFALTENELKFEWENLQYSLSLSTP